MTDANIKETFEPLRNEVFSLCAETPGYKISNYGRVLSLYKIIIRSSGRKQTFKERLLKTQTNPKGYPTITLRAGSKKRCFEIHRLVGKCFVVNHCKKPLVHHIDGNKKNNFYKNLTWATYSENIIHAYKTGLR